MGGLKMKYTFLNLAEDVLKNNDYPLTIKEITTIRTVAATSAIINI